MPSLPGFSDNPLVTREDLSTATFALLTSLQRHQSAGGARIRIPTATGTVFDEVAAQLEGFARPLWALAALAEGAEQDDERVNRLIKPFVSGLASCTDPAHEEYWGPLTGHDQRMVEMEIISFALLAAPNVFYTSQCPTVQFNIKEWLRSINEHLLPTNNWLWFRVMTNLASIKCCGVAQEELWPLIDNDFRILDTFYIDQGWSADGPWTDEKRQADYYSGSFAIQFSQLLYTKFASDIDHARCETYRERARAFATDFLLYFDKNGAAIPFGRSLTYRFAFAGFWAAAAYAEIDTLPLLHEVGAIKGLLLRHLRWWTSKSEIFNVDGTLNIGFVYPNMYMSEDYNSPQSPYWCMKSLVVLALPGSHPFWVEQESELPANAHPLARAVPAPYQILCNTGSHHYMLSSGQFCAWPHKAAEAKYGKFAYSSAFGFSVPTGPLLHQIAPDSTLALSVDVGETWRIRQAPMWCKWATAALKHGAYSEELPVLVSGWKPWSMLDVVVTTALISPSKRWPDWHIRIHKVTASTTSTLVSTISAVEGGFAINGRKMSDGRPIAIASEARTPQLAAVENSDSLFESVIEVPDGCCVFSVAGASGVHHVELANNKTRAPNVYGALLKPDANTNLMQQRTVIPTLRTEISLQGLADDGQHVMAAAVFATTRASAAQWEQWTDPPVLNIGQDKLQETGAYIQFSAW